MVFFMAISAVGTRYDAILLNRQKQRDAADLREARSEARQQMAQATLAKADTLRNTMAVASSDANYGQSQLIAQLIRSRMNIDAASRSAPTKWYRS